MIILHRVVTVALSLFHRARNGPDIGPRTLQNHPHLPSCNIFSRRPSYLPYSRRIRSWQFVQSCLNIFKGPFTQYCSKYLDFHRVSLQTYFAMELKYFKMSEKTRLRVFWHIWNSTYFLQKFSKKILIIFFVRSK